jgi:cyclopropane fatty-acyl-phospholipid synthase-like methyltransferase
MPNDNKTYLKFDHDAYAKSRDPNDFWGQVRRTVQGVPVSDDQIKMIVDVIHSELDIKPNDILLDIACGNGALSHFLFQSCAGYLGVDLSEHLISIAKANFEALPNYQFMHQEALEYVRAESLPEKFSKVVCYGSFPYFPAIDAVEVLRILFEKFSNVQNVFIGNLPDKDLAVNFYKRQPNTEELADCFSQIGIWRTQHEFAELATNAGWKVKFSTMPDRFYSSYYRYDVLLSR